MVILLSPDEFFNLFNAELIEFWVASLFLSGLLVFLGFRLLRLLSGQKYQTSEAKTNQKLSQIAWREFKKRSVSVGALAIAVVLYTIALLAPLLAPFSPNSQQDLTVTAYKPPLARFDVIVLKDSIRQNIPLRTQETISASLANTIIETNHILLNRGQTHKSLYVNSYSLERTHIVVKKGSRTRTIPFSSVKGGDKFMQQPDSQIDQNPDFIASIRFLLGTDQYGRDILSRVIYGSRISLSIGFLVVLIAVTLGTILGVVSGYFGGFTDNLIMRFVDILIAFPGLFLILIIIATFGNSIYLIVITLSLTGWMGVSRLVRSQILTLKEQEFILAAKSLGLSSWRIIFKHLVPNTLTPVIVAATLRIGSIILTEAGLSFLGLGVQPPTASWGNIINEGRDNLLNHWWISTFPGLAIVLTVICFNLIGDGARDALDPRMRD